jgi:hypothetical protein
VKNLKYGHFLKLREKNLKKIHVYIIRELFNFIIINSRKGRLIYFKIIKLKYSVYPLK